jgi:hypothetical protein
MATLLITATYSYDNATRVALPLMIAKRWRPSWITLTDSSRIF